MSAPLLTLDPTQPVSIPVAARARQAVDAGQVRLLAINGLNARQHAAMTAAGVDLGPIRHARGHVNGHRVELDAERHGYHCDCLAYAYGRLCYHPIALLAVVMGHA